MTEEDMYIEYILCNECNRTYSCSLKYHGFTGNFMRVQVRRGNRSAYQIEEEYDKLGSKRTKYEERCLILIDHYCLMQTNCTLKCNLQENHLF